MNISTFTRYQDEVNKFQFYPEPNTPNGLIYCILALNGEAGEVANKLKKVIRDNQGVLHREAQDEIMDELGDVLWYLTSICSEMGVPLQNVVYQNIAKLQERRKGASATSSPKIEEPSGEGIALNLDDEGVVLPKNNAIVSSRFHLCKAPGCVTTIPLGISLCSNCNDLFLVAKELENCVLNQKP